MAGQIQKLRFINNMLNFVRMSRNGNVIGYNDGKHTFIGRQKFIDSLKVHKKRKHKSSQQIAVNKIQPKELEKLQETRKSLLTCLLMSKILGRKILSSDHETVFNQINEFLLNHDSETFLDILQGDKAERQLISENVKANRIKLSNLKDLQDKVVESLIIINGAKE